MENVEKIDLMHWPEPDLNAGEARAKTLEEQNAELKGRCEELERELSRPVHRPLGSESTGLNHKVVIEGINVYITTAEYEDGSLGEIGIKIDRQGGMLRIYGQWAEDISLALQYGIPPQVFINRWKYQNFQPFGVTSNEQIPMVKSIMDYLARWLEIKYPHGKRDTIAPKRAI